MTIQKIHKARDRRGAKNDSYYTPNPQVELQSDGRHAILLSDFKIMVSLSKKRDENERDARLFIQVPKGFVTDFASIPQLFWSIAPPTGKYASAAVVHDYLYATHTTTKAVADKVFLILMQRYGVGYIKRKIMYYAVRMFGGSAWNKAREVIR